MALAELELKCPRLLHVWYRDPNGHWSPVVAVDLGAGVVEGLVEDTVRGARLWSVDTYDAAIRTPEGLGVGSTYRDLKSAYGRSEIHSGVDECTATEVSFNRLPGVVFDLPPARSLDCEAPTESELEGDTVWRVFVPRPTPAEVARRDTGGPRVVTTEAFIAATSPTWPPPSPTYAAGKMPWQARGMPHCGTETPVIAHDSLGPLAIGQTQAQLRERCQNFLHVWVLDQHGEPALALKLGDSRIIARMSDTMPSSTVRLIDVSDPAPRTAEGFGVGTRVLDILAAHRDPAMISGKESCVLFFQSLRGLTFVLNPKDCKTHAPGERVRIEQLFSADAKVTEIWIKGSH